VVDLWETYLEKNSMVLR